jgi:NAD(P)-dependent dehydrogenase (short-subunit alcohol dehydrogenase family)
MTSGESPLLLSLRRDTRRWFTPSLKQEAIMYKDLKGKTALITGAGKETGIGYAIASKLAADGVNIIIADLTEKTADPLAAGDEDTLVGLARKLSNNYGVKTLAAGLDVTRTASVTQMADAIKETFSRVDILCNNAGSVFGVPSAVHTYEEDAWMRTIDVNLHGVFRVSKAIVPMMPETGGSIINSASQAAKKPPLFNGAYAAAKAGVLMMTKVMAQELAGAGIRVNAICPGVIMTDFTKWRFDLEAQFLGSTSDERKELKCREIPLGRLGTIEEVADLVAFLASSASAYMTGQALNITGGQMMEI